MSVRPVSRNDVDAEYYDEAEWVGVLLDDMGNEDSDVQINK